jgi:hypothetical protein
LLVEILARKIPAATRERERDVLALFPPPVAFLRKKRPPGMLELKSRRKEALRPLRIILSLST